MKRMITITLTSILLLGALPAGLFAQGKKMPEVMQKAKDRIDPASIAGLHNYDAGLLLKTLKVRKAAKKDIVSDMIEQYNSSLTGLKDENMGLLVGLGISVKDIIQEKDFKSLWASRSDYKEKVSAVRQEHAEMHTALESGLSEVLTKRQRRKWFNYQETLRKQDDATFDMGDLFSFVGM
jgi:Spy/CpxP family protein refolding chaperone